MRPSILIARAVFPEVAERLRRHLDVLANDADEPWSQAQLIQRLQGRQGVFVTTGERIDVRLLDACPALRAVCSMAVGYDNVDVQACTTRGILVTNAPDVLTETTADFGLALMMATARRISEGERYLRSGAWQRWSVDQFAGMDIHGTTLGILGMGRIGRAIARRGALGFGMRVVFHNRTRPEPPVVALGDGVEAAWHSLDELLALADHLVIALPYAAQTRHIVGARELALMKPAATLVNIGRGGVVDDAALAQALHAGRLAGAGLDVFENEPAVHPGLLGANNVVLTPHIASASRRTRLAMANLAADNLLAAMTGGCPPTPVNPVVLDADGRFPALPAKPSTGRQAP